MCRLDYSSLPLDSHQNITDDIHPRSPFAHFLIKIIYPTTSSKNPKNGSTSAPTQKYELILTKKKKIVNIKPKEKEIIPTGISVAIPVEYEIQIRPRSGLSAKNNISILNTPGTIDADYRGEIKVILINLGSEDFQVKRGDRIAQMSIHKVNSNEFEEVNKIEESNMREKGFGSTGNKYILDSYT